MFGEIKSVIFVSVGAVALGAAVWRLFNSNNKEEQIQQSIQDQTLIRFLKDLRAQCYPHYFLVAGIVRQVKQQQGSNFQIVFQRVKEEVELLFQKKQSMILFKLELDLDNVISSINLTRNEQVKILNEQIQKLYDDALEGIDPPLNLNSKTTQKYTKEQLLTIMGKILKVSVEVICLAIQELESSGKGLTEYKLDQPNFMRALNNNGITDRKLGILIQENLTEFEEPDTCPIELFSKLIQYHKINTPKFKKCVDDVESHFEFIISRLLKREIDSEGAINAAEKIDLVQILKMLQ